MGTSGSDHTMLLERAKDLFDAGKHKAQTLAHYLGLIVQPRLQGQANSEQQAKRQAADGQGMLKLALSMNVVVRVLPQEVKQSVPKVTARVTNLGEKARALVK